MIPTTYGIPRGDPTLGLPRVNTISSTGLIRSNPEHFMVFEDLSYSADGQGEHVFLTIQKTGENTQEIARRLALLAAVPVRDVGFAGMKDRNAVTCQSFTVRLAGRPEPDWSQLEDDAIRLISAERHSRKIRRGSLKGNRFRILVTDLAGDRQALEQNLRQIKEAGVPNYFGPQRFGRDGSNLQQAKELFTSDARVGREKKSMLLSAVRSHLFNQVLARRVTQQTWNQMLAGDVMLIDDAHGQFMADLSDASIQERADTLVIHPSGPLPGSPGRSREPEAAVAALEAEILGSQGLWVQGLMRFGVDRGRRALRLLVSELDWAIETDELHLSFRLTAGAYATTVLRELIDLG